MDKFEIAAKEIATTQTDNRTVLDAGCRDCIFSRHAPAGWDYSGLDLYQNEACSVRFVQSVEDPIPVADRAFGAVVALDVVEHVDQMSHVMDELWRVADHKLIVALPNMAWVLYRLDFLRRGYINEKYRVLPYGHDDSDRHRWLTTAAESTAFMQSFAEAKGDVAAIRSVATAETGKRKLITRLAKAVGLSEQFYAPTMVYTLERG